jgi:hypothetical protein
MTRKQLATQVVKAVVPTVPEGDGNNVTSPSAKYKYDFVINNWTQLEFTDLCQTLDKIAKKAVVGSEVGEKGTPHLQGYISLHKKERIATLRVRPGLQRASFRKCRNEDALIEYCQKDGVVLYRKGFPLPVRVITELYPWQKEIESIYLTEPDTRSIYWFWEPKGNIGKSAFVKYMIVKYKALYCDGGKKSDLMNLVFNSNMDECKCVIWDLPRSTKGNISYATLECVKNGMVCNTKYETGMKVFNPPHIFVFANFPPDDVSQLSSDRWKIKRLAQETVGGDEPPTPFPVIPCLIGEEEEV